MEVVEAIRRRRSVREYENTPVPMEHIRLILEAARWAPSGYNKQPWKFIVLQDPALKARMAEEVRAKLDEISRWPEVKGKASGVKAMLPGFIVFSRAPVAIAVLHSDYVAPMDEILIKKGLSFEERFKLRAAPGVQSVAAAIQNMLLAATSLGYGTCYGTGCLIARQGLEEILGIKSPWRLIAIVPVGIPKKAPRPPKRKPLEGLFEIR
jgi:nitroreductase